MRQWRAGRGVKLAGVTVTPPARSKAPKSPASTTSPLLGANPEFVAIEMSAPAKTVGRVAADPADAAPTAEPLIQIELRRGPLHLNVRWPTSAADDCTTWLRELSSGIGQRQAAWPVQRQSSWPVGRGMNVAVLVGHSGRSC